MKVYELIEELRDHDREAEVVLTSGWSTYGANYVLSNEMTNRVTGEMESVVEIGG